MNGERCRREGSLDKSGTWDQAPQWAVVPPQSTARLALLLTDFFVCFLLYLHCGAWSHPVPG